MSRNRNTKTEAQNLVNGLFGRTVDVIEATKPLGFRVRPEHYVVGTECDPINCTLANAIKDRPDVLTAIVLLTVSYVLFKDDPDRLHRFDNRGKLKRVLPTMKLIKGHDAKAQLAIPPAGFDVILFPNPPVNRLIKNRTASEVAATRKMKRESKRRTDGKTKRRNYRRSVSGLRQNVLSAFIVGAMSNKTEKNVG